MIPATCGGYVLRFSRQTPEVLRAVYFATLAHDGQRRRYTNEPYIVHPLAVATGVSEYVEFPQLTMAAVLHDVMEDCNVKYFELDELFGQAVATLVRDCTDVYTSKDFPHLKREERKLLEAKRIGEAGFGVAVIKAFDLLDNWPSIKLHDPKFAKVYLAEKQMLIPHMLNLPLALKRRLEKEIE